MSCEAYFAEQLRERGYRLTPQREAVLSILHHLDGFVTAEEIYEHVAHETEHSPEVSESEAGLAASVDLSTVYRTMDLLAELGLVAVLDAGDGQRRYELVGPHGLHHHLHCTACGTVIPLAHDELEPLLDHLRLAYGFTAQPGSLTLQGLCAKCSAESELSPGHLSAHRPWQAGDSVS